ncbi:MAG TPA: thermosome subunit alpha [Nitrososphaeraceae archaeon]|nr:thermosome subunit alpha [Nitrososphaeraceae archaeon]
MSKVQQEIMKPTEQLFGQGVRRSKDKDTRRYNLLAARLIADLIKNSLGPCGMEKMFIDVLGEVTVTKDGATLLRKLDIEHPAAKVMIEASNAVDNEVGDGTTSVVVLAGALLEKAEQLLDKGISPSIISSGYLKGLEISLKILEDIGQISKNSDREIMERLAATSLRSKMISYNIGKQDNIAAKLVVDAICTITDFTNNQVDVDDIKIEEKPGNMSDIQLVKGVVIDKTIDNSAMPRRIENAKILLINEDLEGKRTKTDAEIRILSPDQIQAYFDKQLLTLRSKVQNIINSRANVVISQKGIDLLAQSYLAKAGIISIRRVKENDLLWLEKATGAKILRDLDNNTNFDKHLGYAGNVYEKFVGNDKMVFVEDCKNPKSATILLRANSKRLLDECHRSILDAIAVIKDFIIKPSIVAGGGSPEAIIASRIRRQARSITGREQIVVEKFAEALEEIPLVIATNGGMNIVDTLVQLRSKCSSSAMLPSNGKVIWYGVNAIERKVEEIFSNAIEPVLVKEQVIKTAVEVTNLLISVDDVLMAKPIMNTHTHADGTEHSHPGGDKKHDHYFDKLGKRQRPMHHYY